ncbi:MAG: metal-dependent hydrolase [Patescibacteria group bacterium]
MAGYKGHIAGAVGVNMAYVLTLTVLPWDILDNTGGLFASWQFLAALFVISMLFGLWPDIDTNSRGQDIFFGAAFSANIILIWQGYIEASAYLGLMAMTPIIGKHRGWTHSKWAMVFIPLPVVLVSYFYRPEMLVTALVIYGAAVSGYFSHLLLDGRITRLIRVKT